MEQKRRKANVKELREKLQKLHERLKLAEREFYFELGKRVDEHVRKNEVTDPVILEIHSMLRKDFFGD